MGTYSPVAIYVDDQTCLFLGADNTLYWANAANNDDGNYYINACRAYFHIGKGISTMAARSAGTAFLASRQMRQRNNKQLNRK